MRHSQKKSQNDGTFALRTMSKCDEKDERKAPVPEIPNVVSPNFARLGECPTSPPLLRRGFPNQGLVNASE